MEKRIYIFKRINEITHRITLGKCIMNENLMVLFNHNEKIIPSTTTSGEMHFDMPAYLSSTFLTVIIELDYRSL